jgi:DNA topoisomerase I
MKRYKKTSYPTFTKGTSLYLVIVESPSKCGKIESYLGEQYKCVSSKGHLRELDSIKNFDIKYKNISDKEPHIELLKNVISQYPKENIILATDDDREGEAIAWHICDLFELDYNTTVRITFNEITKNAIQKSIQNPKLIDMKLVNSQKARQVLDLVVGYKISPLLWKYACNDKSKSLSAGRCQTPALRLIYDNHLLKKNSENEVKYKITGSFLSKNITFNLNKELNDQETVKDFLKKTISFKHELSLDPPRDAEKKPPEPFNTSKLLQTASNVLHISPKETMSLCQILYQDGFITYMRTESKKYSDEFLTNCSNYIQNNYKEDFVGNLGNIMSDDKTPHEAIRITNIERKYINKDKRIDSLYSLIWRNTIESCMSNAKFKIVDCKITAPNEYYYKNSIETPIFHGWRIISEKDMDNSNTAIQNTNNGLLLYLNTILSQKTSIIYNSVTASETVHTKHSHYNECSLVKKLEELEIGRPSTFSTFVDTIQQRGYVKKQNIEGIKCNLTNYTLTDDKIKKTSHEKIIGNEQNKLVIQPIGVVVIEFLVKNFEEIFSYDYTKIMECNLDEILQGVIDDWLDICIKCDEKIKELEKPLKNLTKETFKIDDKNIFMFSRNGPTVKETNEDGTFTFKSVKKDMNIDMEKMKKGEYTLDELVETNSRHLGEYEDAELYIKNGKYGLYAEWGDNKKGVSALKQSIDTVTFEDVVEFLKNGSEVEYENRNVLRVINDDITVRKGKFGAYVYYKTKTMNKPEFYNIKKFPEGFRYCKPEVLIQWLHENYNMPIH